MTDGWSLIMDDCWLITDDWWLMIDDWWLMSDEWWLMIDDKLNTNIIWNVKYRLPQGGPTLGQTIWGPFHIIFVFILSSIINHHSSLINHQSSIISHQPSVINHQSSMINDQSSVINYQSSMFCSTFCDHLLKQNKKHTSSKKKGAQKVSPGGTRKKG